MPDDIMCDGCGMPYYAGHRCEDLDWPGPTKADLDAMAAADRKMRDDIAAEQAIGGGDQGPPPRSDPPNANRITVAIAPVLVDRRTAAAMMGCSLGHFERHIQPALSIVYSGRLRLIPVAELERWAKAHMVKPIGSR